MFRNFFISAHRNIVGNKLQSAIQVISLSIGLNSMILIGLTLRKELSYDKFNENYERIYRLEFGDMSKLVPAIGHRIKQNLPEAENVVRLVTWESKEDTRLFRYWNGDTTEILSMNIPHQYWADSSFFDVFTVHLIQGNRKTALRIPKTCVISESTARRVFGDEDPVGRKTSMGIITGIFKDLKQSHLEINVLGSMISPDSIGGYARGDSEYLNTFGSEFNYITYLMLAEGTDPGKVEQRIDELIKPLPQAFFYADSPAKFHLRPLKNLYFNTGIIADDNYSRHGNLDQLRILALVALIILILALINYTNLATARASIRIKEVAVRKVLGASMRQTIFQFQVESILFVLFSLAVALTLSQLIIPGFNNLALTELELHILWKPFNFLIIFLSALVIGALAGIYPAISLGKIEVSPAFSGKAGNRPGSLLLRRILLTVQFGISLILIISVLTIFRQLHFMKFADLGFDKGLVVTSSGVGQHGNDGHWQKRVKERLLKDPSIMGVTFAQAFMGDQLGVKINYRVNGTEHPVPVIMTDPDYLNVFDIELVEGRNFSWDRPADYTPGPGPLKNTAMHVLVNESAVELFGLESPVGTTLSGSWDDPTEQVIIGVVKDHHFRSLQYEIRPLIYYWGLYRGKAAIRISPYKVSSTLSYIEEVFKSEMLGSNEQFTFLDDRYQRQYRRDEQYAILITVFTVVALILACLGLFGLSSFMAARKVKEIGVRKVLGASEKSVYRLLALEFTKWVAISILVALPAGVLLMHRWLQNYAYHTTVVWWIPLMTILIAFMVTFFTVSWHSLRTARTNPVNALRYE